MAKRNLISIGIDPGSRHGAVAIIDSDLNILVLQKLPFIEVEVKSRKLKPKLNKESGRFEKNFKKRAWTDFTKLRPIFINYVQNDIVYTIEKVSPRPGEGESTSFIFGNALGCLQGLYTLLDPVEYFEPLPQVWKAHFGLIGMEKKGSIDLVNKIFGEQLKKNKIVLKSVTSHSDLAESLLLALYGLIRHFDLQN